MAVPPRVARLRQTTWTSAEPVEGWRHFHVVEVRRGPDGWVAELAASCDDARRVTVPTRALFAQAGWTSGWTPLREL
jgi:tryptophan-rich hypothetical protein